MMIDMYYLDKMQNLLTLQINTIGYFLPARLPGLIVGYSVALYCNFFFEFLVGINYKHLLILGAVYSSCSIRFAK